MCPNLQDQSSRTRTTGQRRSSMIRTSSTGRVAIVTGANSGIGYAIAQRLLEHGLAQNDPITVLMACRNAEKAHTARSAILADVAAKTKDVDEELLQILIVDLANTKSVFLACADFKNRFSRLDFLILNAGVLPCSHMDVKTGVKNLLTRPLYVCQTGGGFYVQTQGALTSEGIGETFAANVFGHYIMVKELTDVMQLAPLPRVLWSTSTTADSAYFHAEDYQCVKGTAPYESSKRLCELLALDMQAELQKKNIHSFLVSPGNCFTGILTQGWIINFCWVAVLYIMRFLSISGCNVSPRNGTTSTMYLTCEVTDPSTLDSKMLYHSDITPLGKPFVRKLPVESMARQDALREVRRSMDDLYSKHRGVALTAGSVAS
ncbi:hypothetical protein DFS34DRAFT_622073 [Phlyctochytrium arcticum]|nr:hypothetical protein DFS34DRAFT_622073 [Phlyctochytrium arcticum]